MIYLVFLLSFCMIPDFDVSCYWFNWDDDPYVDGIVVESPFDCGPLLDCGPLEAEIELWISPIQGEGTRLGKRRVYSESGLTDFRIAKENIQINPYVDQRQAGIVYLRLVESGKWGVGYIDLWNHDEPWDRNRHTEGNVNWDDYIDEDDLKAVTASLDCFHTEDCYDGRCDFNNNGYVDSLDYDLVIKNMELSTSDILLTISADKLTCITEDVVQLEAIVTNVSNRTLHVRGTSVECVIMVYQGEDLVFRYPWWETWGIWEFDLTPGERRYYHAEWDIAHNKG